MNPSARWLFFLRSCVGAGVESTALTLHARLGSESYLAILEAFGDLEPLARTLPRVLWPAGQNRTASQKEDLRFALRALPRMFHYARQIRRSWEAVQPRAVFTHSGVDLLVAARLAGLKGRTLWVAGVGSDVYRDLNSKHPRWRWLWRPIVRHFYSGPDHWVASSQGLARTLQDQWGIPASKLHVIPNPVDLERVEKGRDEPLPEGFPEDFLLGVGRLSQTKGFDRWLSAMSQLPEPWRSLPLVILGEGEEREALQSQAQKLGLALSMPGFEENPWRFMGRARVVVVPSRLEGFSNVTVEALACAAPVLVCDCPHGPREISDQGTYAELVEPTPEALARGLARLLELPERLTQLRQQGPKRAEAYSAPHIAGLYQKLLTQLIGP